MELKNNTAGAFSMPISYIGTSGNEITITGTIERGKIKLNDPIQLVGMGKKVIDAKVIAISKKESSSSNKKGNTVANDIAYNTELTENSVTNSTTTIVDTKEMNLKQALKGEEVTLTIASKDEEKLTKENISRGQVACEPYTYNQYNTFTASVKIDKNSLFKMSDLNNNLQIYIRLVDINGKVSVINEDSGNNGTVSVNMESYVAIEQGTEISIRKDGKTIATGKITSVSNT